MSQHTPAHNIIVQIKLLGVTKPPVWRRVQLRADTRLDQLHEILQAALGWENYHLHAFSFGEEEFGPRDPELALDFADERKVTLGELTDIGARFRYTYDFGDNWEHEILVEDLLDPDPNTRYPILVAAKGACPPEDCGGTWSYTDLKAILANPGDEQHHEMLEWLGLENASEFDPNTVPNDTIDYELALTGASR